MIRALVVSWVVVVSLGLPLLLTIMGGLVSLARWVRARVWPVDPETRALAALEQLYQLPSYAKRGRVS